MRCWNTTPGLDHTEPKEFVMTQLIYTSIPSVSVKAAAAQIAAKSILYIPQLADHPGKTYIPELSHGDTTLHTIVADIAGAQHDDVVRVLAVDLAAGTSWDASKEVAAHVLDIVLTEHGHVPAWCIDFCQEHLGIGVVNDAERQAA